MKILHIITSLQTGGAEKLIVDLLPLLNRDGRKVDLLLLNGEETPFLQQIKERGIKVLYASKSRSVYDLRHILKIRKMIKGYDIIHTHNYTPQLFTVIASLGLSVKLVTTEHSTSNRRRSIKCYKYLDCWMYSHYHRIVCISDQTEASLRTYLNRRDGGIVTICNGVDVKKYSSALPSEEIVTTYIGSKIICMVAGFRSAKDHKTIIRTLCHLPNDYHLLLVGIGETMEECKSYVKSLSLSERVHFLGQRMDVAEVMKAATCLVLSSHWEGFGLVAVEGMATGTPIIVSDVPGLAEVVAEGGILFPKGDEHFLAKSIRDLCEHEDLYQTMSLRGKKRALQFDISRMLEKYLQVYEVVQEETRS